MKSYFILTILLLLIITVARAQRTYLETEVSKEVFKNFDVTFSPQVKFREGLELKQYFFDAGIEYKINKNFAFGTSYRLGTNITNDGEKENFGRFSFDAKAKLKWDRLEPKFRLRYTNVNDDLNDVSDSKYNFLRYKLELGYNFANSGFSPYIFSEYFQNFTTKNLNGIRFEGGVSYKMNKHNSVGAYYRVNMSTGENNCFDVIGLSYKLNL